MCEEASRGDGYPMPNSSQFVFPMIVAPEAFSRWTTVASKGDWKSSATKKCKGSVSIRASGRDMSVFLLRSIEEEQVVGISLVHMLSLIATVIPFNCPCETGVGSSGTTYMSAFTLAFFCLTACRHETCVAVVAKKQECLLVCCRRHGRMTFDPVQCALASKSD